MKKRNQKWSIEEVNNLINYYPIMTKKEIIPLFPNRTYASINLKAFNLQLKKKWIASHPFVKANLWILLEENPISYYWMGFIAADGSFVGKDGNRLKLQLAKKDWQHLEKFANFISYSYNNGKAVTVKDIICCQKIKNKFGLVIRKTYNPPEINLYKKFSVDNLISYIIGFIDGDGNIGQQPKRKDCAIRIKLHNTWLEFLNFISYYIYKTIAPERLAPKASINKQGYANLHIAYSKVIKGLKKFVKKLRLPVLERKWSVINEEFISKSEIAFDRRKKIEILRKQGLTNTEIARVLGISKATVTLAFKRRITNE